MLSNSFSVYTLSIITFCILAFNFISNESYFMKICQGIGEMGYSESDIKILHMMQILALHKKSLI